MNRAEIESVLRECLSAVVPGVDFDAIDPTADLREEAELDSMDMLNLVIALHKRLHVDVPEVDVPKLATLDGATEYLAGRVKDQGSSARAPRHS